MRNLAPVLALLLLAARGGAEEGPGTASAGAPPPTPFSAPGPRLPMADWGGEEAAMAVDPRVAAMLRAARQGRATKPLLRELRRAWQLLYPFEDRPPADLRRRVTAARAPATGLTATPWTESGPTNIGGRTTAIAFVGADPDHALVAAAGGGVWRWRWVNGSSQWTPLFDAAPTLSIGSLAVDPVDPARVYVGTGEMNFSLDEYDGVGLVRSLDGGSSWLPPVPVGGAGRIGSLAIRPDLPSTLFAGTSGGLHRSTDSGASFSLVLGGGAATAVVLHPASPGTVFAAVQGLPPTASGLWRSTAGGAAGSFAPLTGSAGCQFPALGPDIRIALAGSISAPGTLYAAVGRGTGEVWKSQDGGDSWCPAAAPANLCGDQCWYDLTIAVDPADANHVLLGGIALYRSVDGAGSFAKIGPAHVDHHALAFAPPGGGIALDGNDGGLVRMSFPGGSAVLADVSQGYVSAQYYGLGVDPLDAARVYGGTQDNGAHRLLEPATGAARLAPGACGDGGNARAHPTIAARIFWNVCPIDGQLHLLVSDDRGISRSEAVAGIAVAEGADWAAPIEVGGPTTLLTATSDRVYRTTNSSAPPSAIVWAALGSTDLTPAGGTVTTIAAVPEDGRMVWAGTSHGQVWLTTDGGVTWRERWLVAGGRARWVGRIVAVPGSPGRAWLSLGGWKTPDSGGHVYYTADGGSTWSDRSGNLPDLPVAALALDPANPQQLWAGSWAGVFESANAGLSWQPAPGMPTAPITDLAFDPASGTIRAATHGRGLWRGAVSGCESVAIAAGGNLCSSGAVTLDASAGFQAHRWSTGATTPSISVAPALTSVYCLDAQDSLGCPSAARRTVPVPRYADVPCADPFFDYIARLEVSGVSAGCSSAPPRYCPAEPVTRGQMAVFLLKALGVTPPPVTTPCFADVPAANPFAPWICELARRGITGGCAASPPRYCPDAPVDRAQMAVFLLRARAIYPPAPTATCFQDVALGDPFAPWICELAARGITGGCSTAPPLYCPGNIVTRAQMAAFLSRAFDLEALAPCAAR